MIKFDNVTSAYGDGHKVLQGISFHIKDGESVGLIGANGAGKSTLMKTALGLLPSEGDVTIAGTKLTVETLGQVRKNLGYVLQDSDNQMFMPTVLEDMIFGPLNYGMERKEAEEKADAVLEKLNLSYLRDRHNYKISGGEKKMAAIATILTMNPKAICMDEPSANLDPKNRRKLINMLNELKVTKLIAAHDLDMILDTCDRVILISKGQIIADGPAKEILLNQELLEQYDLELPFIAQTMDLK